MSVRWNWLLVAPILFFIISIILCLWPAFSIYIEKRKQKYDALREFYELEGIQQGEESESLLADVTHLDASYDISLQVDKNPLTREEYEEEILSDEILGHFFSKKHDKIEKKVVENTLNFS